MEIRQLRHFLAVVDNGSLSVAARKLRMSQGALTTSIKMLEKSLSTTLFTRTNHGMTLNEYGRSLEARARIVLSEIGQAESDIRELQGKERARVAIGAAALFSDHLLPQAMTHFRGAHPEIEVTIEHSNFDTALLRLRDGTIDCAFFTLTGRTLPRDLDVEVLLRGHRAFVITRSDNPLAKRRNLKARDVLAGPWLMTTPNTNFRTRLDGAFRAAGLTPPAPAMEYSVHGAARNLLRSGRYLAVISDGLVQEELAAGVLSVVDVPELEFEFDAGVVWRRGIALSAAAKTLVDVMRSFCAGIVAKPDTVPHQVLGA
jgi:DNA-binding transcriptional LysR family regulator